MIWTEHVLGVFLSEKPIQEKPSPCDPIFIFNNIVCTHNYYYSLTSKFKSIYVQQV